MAATKSKILKYTGALFSLLLFSTALWVLHREVQTVHLQQILSELESIPERHLWLAAILTVSNYTIMAGYDYLAIRFIKHSLSLTRIALASFIGNAFRNNIGFPMLVGASVRYRIYSEWGLSAVEITKVVAFCTLTLLLGYFSMGGMVFVLMPLGILPESYIPFHTTLPLGVLFLGVLTGYVALTAFHRKPVRFRGWEIAVPSLPILVCQILVACVDWLLAGAVLYTLLPSEAAVPFLNFIGVYFLAQMAGLASQIPGGLGVFETAMLMLFPHSMTNPVAGNSDRLSGDLLPATPERGDGSARHPRGIPRKKESIAPFKAVLALGANCTAKRTEFQCVHRRRAAHDFRGHAGYRKPGGLVETHNSLGSA
jgi:phosphatidylglycerol lysyltransferase